MSAPSDVCRGRINHNRREVRSGSHLPADKNTGLKRPVQRGVITIIKIQSEISLASACPVRYRGIASNGCCFFLITQGSQAVIQLDRCFRETGCFPTCRCYTSLCYDPCMCCFWASDGRSPSVLYQLDACFREVNFVRLRDAKTGAGVGVITGISYDCKEKSLLLAAAIGLVWVSIRGNKGFVTCTHKTNRWVVGAIAAEHHYFYCYLAEDRQMIRCCLRNGKTLWERRVPKDLYVDAAVFACSPRKNGRCCLFVLASKHCCYPYVLECVPVDGAFDPDLCCQCKPKPPHPEPKPCEDLLESVALMQMAISNILNAEAEKLQRTIAATDDPDILLEANRSVNRTVISATFLEQVLYQKLELIQELCDPCKPETPRSPMQTGSEVFCCE